MTKVSAYAFIPARGGSKGVPGKNLQRVGGRPLVSRTVAAARAATTIDRVFVSTDSAEIAEVARAAGAEVIERPAGLGGDEASSESALLHALDALREQGVPEPDVCVMLQCTSPFTLPEDVDGTVGRLEADGADCALTAAPTHAFLWRRGARGAEAVNHDAAARPRRQDRVPELVETGAVYAMRTVGLRAAAHRFFGRIALHEVPSTRALEIDDPTDLAAARALAPLVENGRTADTLPRPVRAVVLDFDGVMTDNRVVTLQDGTEAVVCDRSDGLGLERLRASEVRVLVLSKERNPVVAVRCEKLGVALLHGVDDKGPALEAWLASERIDARHAVFVGNDVNDLDCIRIAGCGAVVADAHPAALAAADLVLTRPGGRGAVREVADLVLDRLGAATP